MANTLQQHQLRAAVGGSLAGGVGGLAVLALWATRALHHGQDPWIWMKLGAAGYFGPEVVTPGFAWSPVVLGMAVHLYVAMTWGFVFGMIVYGLSRLATLACGLGLGAVCFAVMRLCVVPLLGLSQVGALGLSLHLCFGLITAAAFLVAQRPMDLETLQSLLRKAREPHGRMR